MMRGRISKRDGESLARSAVPLSEAIPLKIGSSCGGHPLGPRKSAKIARLAKLKLVKRAYAKVLASEAQFTKKIEFRRAIVTEANRLAGKEVIKISFVETVWEKLLR